MLHILKALVARMEEN